MFSHHVMKQISHFKLYDSSVNFIVLKCFK